MNIYRILIGEFPSVNWVFPFLETKALQHLDVWKDSPVKCRNTGKEYIVSLRWDAYESA